MKKIAIIGSGISGLTAAHLLHTKHDITLFESNDYIGGHTATKDIEYGGKTYAIDTGFIVCNDKTYPNFLKLMDKIGIKRRPTEMSFSVKNIRNGLEYNGNNLNSLFAQRRNLLKPSFWRLINEILRFNKQCKELYSKNQINPALTLGDFLVAEKFSQAFCENYILPMGAAIWSTSLTEMRAFQLRFFVQFFYNHGLLNISDRPQWYVIEGGSREYIAPLIAGFKDKIRLNSKILKVSRTDNAVQLHFDDDLIEQFDEVIFACHSDQALALLGDATEDEKTILGAISYSANDVVLHTDKTLLPKRPLAWASWNYQLDDNLDRPACVTYNMNILQGITAPTTFCVTLNQTDLIDPTKILAKFVYHHPVFNQKSLAAQQQRLNICGQQHTHFVGAYWHNGFHEDGVKSALCVTERFGVSL
ncbi:NAD(P)/FAD-dependent oxidoreductase [Pseudoalteromonas tunicata]|uniref:NAD(P)/FAD-dependent oxidoreductase n=1 Tax=Pseudoalteromonas tunicata TaxID=314281 RepID=UPI00273F4075|nr:FAD-dependent oxidoreductase [Pseudoalteromonas tunicata]MDP4984790.1 FAD-dependent oxidoreductase [Pseudoalteromonas tunicata]MDP5214163.1 FAD-dependent oxidoreductase [Pseudoalteromonas tunicata]